MAKGLKIETVTMELLKKQLDKHFKALTHESAKMKKIVDDRTKVIESGKAYNIYINEKEVNTDLSLKKLVSSKANITKEGYEAVSSSINSMKEKIDTFFVEFNYAVKNNDKVSADVFATWKKTFDDIKAECDKLTKKDSAIGLEPSMVKELSRTNEYINFASQVLGNYKEHAVNNGSVDVAKVESEKQKLADVVLKANEEEADKRKAEAFKASKAESERVNKRHDEYMKACDEKEAFINHVAFFRKLSQDLAATNKSLFTKQSKQFKEFRRQVSLLNKELAEKKVDLDKVANTMADIVKAKERYDSHCRKHKEQNAVRTARVDLANEAMKQIGEFMNHTYLKASVAKNEDCQEIIERSKMLKAVSDEFSAQHKEKVEPSLVAGV